MLPSGKEVALIIISLFVYITKPTHVLSTPTSADAELHSTAGDEPVNRLVASKIDNNLLDYLQGAIE